MSLKSRLERLERTVDAMLPDPTRPPEDTPLSLWQRALELLFELPPEELEGRRLDNLLVEIRARQAWPTEHQPVPFQICLMRAQVEEETGLLPPLPEQQGRLVRAKLGDYPDEVLIALLRRRKYPHQVDGLPWPYSIPLLNEISADISMTARDLTRDVRCGAITPEQHSAKLAEILPPFTRADLEKAAQKLPDEILGLHLLGPTFVELLLQTDSAERPDQLHTPIDSTTPSDQEDCPMLPRPTGDGVAVSLPNPSSTR